MRLTLPSFLLALTTLANSQRGELSNCPLLGPAYPPADLQKSQVIEDTKKSFGKLIDDAIATGETELGKLNTATASFSIGVFSAQSDKFLYKYHHQGTELDGTLTGDVLNADTLYRIGSVSKLLTVYTYLVKLGPAYWNEPIARFIPELAGLPTGERIHRVQWSEVTLGALAGHMAGLPRNNGFVDVSGIPGAEGIGLPRLNDADIAKCGLPGLPACTREEAVHLMLEQDPATATWHTPVYSNEAFQLLGWAYENITGEPMQDAFSTGILEPLGLSRSFWTPPKNDPNANIVDLDPSVMKDLVGYQFEESLASYTPTGGVYSSLGDLSAIGRSILSSSLLPYSTAREWLRPITHTQHTHSAIGRPWEITRMDVPVTPGSERTRLVDLYAKNGGIGAYLTYLILSPDHDIGFTVMVASQNAFGAGGDLDSTFDVLSELLLDKWVPAAETAARDAAGRDLAGTYVAEDGSDSIVEFALVPGRLGLAVQRLVYNGTDFFSTVGGNLGFQGADLQFVGLKDESGVLFRAVFSNYAGKSSGREPILGKKCAGTWGGAGFINYGNRALDEVVFSVGEDGKPTTVSFPALRVRLIKESVEPSVGGDGQVISEEL